jgi:DNA primase
MVLQYALTRLLPEEILEHNIGWCNDPSQELLWHRMIIPVEDGYYQARDIGDSQNKYLNPEFPAGRRLFNYKALRKADPLVVCEGCISAIAAGNNAVAVMRKSATTQQAIRLSQAAADEIIVAFDSDATYGPGAIKLADHLSACGKKVMIRRYKEGDPDTCQDFEDTPYNMRLKLMARMGAV